MASGVVVGLVGGAIIVSGRIMGEAVVGRKVAVEAIAVVGGAVMGVTVVGGGSGSPITKQRERESLLVSGWYQTGWVVMWWKRVDTTVFLF